MTCQLRREYKISLPATYLRNYSDPEVAMAVERTPYPGYKVRD